MGHLPNLAEVAGFRNVYNGRYDARPAVSSHPAELAAEMVALTKLTF
jgi:hypothetical protein